MELETTSNYLQKVPSLIFLLKLHKNIFNKKLSIIFFQIIYWIIAILSLLQSWLSAKQDFLSFLGTRKPIFFVDFVYHIATAIIRLLSIYLWTFWPDLVDYVLDSIEDYEETIIETITKKGKARPTVQTNVKWLYIFGITSWLAAFGKSIFSSGLSNWQLKSVNLENSGKMAEALLQWQIPENDTSSFYQEKYGSSITVSSISLGVFGMLTDVAGLIQLIVIRDIFLILALTLRTNLQRIVEKIERFAYLPLIDVRQEDRDKMGEYWEMYRKGRFIVADINWAFGGMLKILHVCNELFFAYFMSNCLDTNSTNSLLLWMVFTIAKMLYAYVDAALVHRYVRNSHLIQLTLVIW